MKIHIKTAGSEDRGIRWPGTKACFYLGRRQTGKTTLTGRLDADLSISFIQPDVRQRYEKSPHLLKGEEEESIVHGSSQKRPLVILDEVKRCRISWMNWSGSHGNRPILLPHRFKAPENSGGALRVNLPPRQGHHIKIDL